MENIPTMGLINNTLEDVEEIDASINNMITPELQDLDSLQTCNTKVPIDCCQVKSILFACGCICYCKINILYR